MNRFELNFMFNKLCCAVGATFQIKKSFLLSMVQDVEQAFIEGDRFDEHQKINISEFQAKVIDIFKGYEGGLLG